MTFELQGVDAVGRVDGAAVVLSRRTLVPRWAAGTWSAPNTWVIVAGLLLFGLAWLGHLAHTSLSPPVDSIEQLTWVRSLQWGYYKHPPLPTWLLWLPVKVFGGSATTVTVTGATVTLISMLVLWSLLRTLRGAAHASVALLAVLCITYYNGRLNYFNHNVVLMLASTASAFLCWRAFTTRRLVWWVALGLVLGLGALAKYQIAITICSVVAFWLHQRAWRDPVHRIGALLAMLVALLVFVPHLLWLRAHDFGPVQYAMHSSLGVGIAGAGRVFESLHWLADQLLNRALPAWLLLAASAWIALRTRQAAAPAGPVAADPPTRIAASSARYLLLAWGALPLLLITLLGLATGADLQLHWGTPFLLFTVPAAMELASRVNWSRIAPGRLLTVFVAIQAVLLTVSQLTSPLGPARFRDIHWRSFDATALAARIAPAARPMLGRGIGIVIGEPTTAGALSAALPEHPLVLIDGRWDRSPWVTPDLLRRCGAVALVDRRAGRSDSSERWLAAPFDQLGWHIVVPAANAGPCAL